MGVSGKTVSMPLFLDLLQGFTSESRLGFFLDRLAGKEDGLKQRNATKKGYGSSNCKSGDGEESNRGPEWSPLVSLSLWLVRIV